MLNDVFQVAFFASLLAGTIRIAAPILFAALGELVAERSGVFNLSIEGTMLMGAFAGFLFAYRTESLWSGVVMAVIAGGLVGSLFAFLAVTLKVDQTVAGLTVNIFATAMSFFLFRISFSEVVDVNMPTVSIFERIHIPWLSSVPIIGEAFTQSILTYLAFLLVPVISIFLYRTNRGLELRCLGENPRAVDMKGVNVPLYRFLAVIFGGMMSGVGGAFLSLAASGMWLPAIASGRGWIAFAIVIFGNWKPINILLASLFFGFLDSLQLQIQAIGIQFPYQILLAAPYVLTVLALLWSKRSSGEPLSLGVPYWRERG